MDYRFTSKQLRLWKRVAFIDWFGVLCDRLFYYSILDDPRHPYRVQLADSLERFFDGPEVALWMKGKMQSKDFIDRLKAPLDRRAADDFLLRRLYDDCLSAPLNQPVMKALGRLSARGWYVVLATDNMDCFATAVRRRRDLALFADDVLVSCELGVLKAESPIRFFGDWLKEHGLDAAASVLVDDSERNCNSFRGFGGRAFEVPHCDDSLSIIEALIAE